MSDEAKFKAVIEEMHRLREETGIEKNGKKYSLVKDRVEHFRKVFGSDFGIDTSIVKLDEKVVIVNAKITNMHGTIMASGHSMEFIGANEINMTSYVESAETQAIGRALASFGFHGGEFASESEMSAIDHKRASVRAEPEPPARERPAITGNTMKLYIPAPNDGLTLQDQANKVADELSLAGSSNQLTEYWSRLKPFLEHVETTDKELYSEIKAAFVVAWKIVKGK